MNMLLKKCGVHVIRTAGGPFAW